MIKLCNKAAFISCILTGFMTMFSYGEIPENVVSLMNSRFGKVPHTLIFDVTGEYENIGDTYRVYFSRSSISVPADRCEKVFILINAKIGKEITLSSSDFSQTTRLFQEVVSEPDLLEDFCKLIATVTLKNNETIVGQSVASAIGGSKLLQDEKVSPPRITKGCILFYELNLAGQVWRVDVKSEAGKINVTKTFVDRIPESKK